MPITTMCSATDDGAVDVTSQWKSSSSSADFKLFTRQQYVGCVLETFERNGMEDSDFMAVVWDEQAQCVKTIQYATTRAWTYCNGAVVDATPDVVEKALRYEIARAIPQYIANDRESAATPAKGRICRVVKGRKIAKDEIVTVIGNPQSAKYSMSRWASVTTNVLVHVHSTNVYIHTNIKNLEVVNPQQYYTDESELKLKAEYAVRNSNWISMKFVGISNAQAAAFSKIGNL